MEGLFLVDLIVLYLAVIRPTTDSTGELRSEENPKEPNP
jgi:hypothetical protein